MPRLTLLMKPLHDIYNPLKLVFILKDGTYDKQINIQKIIRQFYHCDVDKV